MSKQKTIRLEHHVVKGGTDAMTGRKIKDQHAWKVLQVTDSIEYHPGQRLEKKDVDMMCYHKRMEGHHCCSI